MAHNNYFQFKQFRIEQERAAMRVGTDGVALGAWCQVAGAKQALDIGTGTGLLALMLAQKNRDLNITAIDIDEGAVLDAQSNFLNSPWPERLKVQQADLKHFALECKQRFDLIVCNPPYFQKSVRSADARRSLARHTDSLPYDDLIGCASTLLTEGGSFNVVLPATEERNFCQLASWKRLFPIRRTRVKPNPLLPPVRVLIELRFEGNLEEEGELTIETAQRHEYTNEFRELVSDFYLNP